MSQQIPQPTAEDRAIDLYDRYESTRYWISSDDIERSLIRRCYTAETELAAERQQREAAEKLVMELERSLDSATDRDDTAHEIITAIQAKADDLEQQLATVRAETVEECAKVPLEFMPQSHQQNCSCFICLLLGDVTGQIRHHNATTTGGES